MVKLVAQFRRPADPEQLLADVVTLVVPHCRAIPGVEERVHEENIDVSFSDASPKSPPGPAP